jgi:hypothetical protein
MADLIQGTYQISFQYMKIDENDAVYTFYQSKKPSSEEEFRMNDLISIMEKKYNVPKYIISTLNSSITAM